MQRPNTPVVQATLLAAALLLAGCLQGADVAPAAEPSTPATVPAFTISPAQAIDGPGANSAEPHVAVRGEGANATVVVGSVEYLEDDHPTRDVRFTIAIHRSLDGGGTWESQLLPQEVLEPVDPLDRTNYVGDPVLSYGPDGTLYLAGVAAWGVWKEDPVLGIPVLLQLNDLTVFVTRSTDDGKTWEPAIFWKRGVGTFGFPVLFAGILEDKEWVTVGPDGAVHFTWTRFVNLQSRIMYARSADGGDTWTAPVVLAQPPDDRMVQGSTIAAPGDGRVYVSWTQYIPGGSAEAQEGRQMVVASGDNGETWGDPAAVGSAAWPRPGHVFADRADPARVLVAAPEGEETPRVWLAESTDGGATWSEPLWLAPHRSGAQQHPAGWVDDAGRARVAYYDAGWPGGERLVLSVVENRTVAFEGAPESPPIDPGPYRREYLGLAGAGDAAWAAWVGGTADNGTHVAVARIAG